jgi:arginase
MPSMKHMARQIVVLDAPSNLGLMPPSPGLEPGVRKLPDALRKHNLIERIGASDAGRVTPPAFDPAIDPQTGVRNSGAIAAYARHLAERVAAIVESGRFPLLLGGDCSILLGPLLALRRMGRFGLCFIDGHLDLLIPETSQTKGAAGMDLALALGYGPTALSNLDEMGPLVQEADVAVVGYRGDVAGYGPLTSREGRPNLLWLPLSDVRNLGAGRTASVVLSSFRKTTQEGFWIHLDVDVLDDEIMPAVDSRQLGGITYNELEVILAELIASPSSVGMEITILDPDLDPDGSVIERFVTFMESLFAGISQCNPGSG